MHSSPSIVPGQEDRDIYLVLDNFGGRLSRAWPETDEDRTNREIVITDLMTGQYSDPVRVVAFNTALGWSRDMSEEIADELIRWYAEQDRDVPRSVRSLRHRSNRRVRDRDASRSCKLSMRVWRVSSANA